MLSRKKRKHNAHTSRFISLGVIVFACIVLAASVLIWRRDGNEHVISVAAGSTTSTTNDKGAGQPQNQTLPTETLTNTGGQSSTGQVSEDKPQPETKSVPTPSPTPPVAPYGIFVSNHTPGQNNAPQQISSLCNTTPGVYCDIQFKLGTSTKSLGQKLTDTSGAATWPAWTPAQIGLSKGSWTVSAIAISGSFSAITTDPIKLEVE